MVSVLTPSLPQAPTSSPWGLSLCPNVSVQSADISSEPKGQEMDTRWTEPLTKRKSLMCQAKPAPRCAAHAKQRLEAAHKSGDKEALRQAQEEYALTATFTKQVRTDAQKSYNEAVGAAERLTDANLRENAKQKAKRDRARKLNYAKNQDAERHRLKKEAERVTYASDTSLALPIVSAFIEKADEPVSARLAAVKNLHSRNAFFATFSVDNMATLFGLPAMSGR